MTVERTLTDLNLILRDTAVSGGMRHTIREVMMSATDELLYTLGRAVNSLQTESANQTIKRSSYELIRVI